MSPIRLARSLLGRLANRETAAGRRWLARAFVASLIASFAGALAGVVPAAVELGVQGITRRPPSSPLARLVIGFLPAGTSESPWPWVGIALFGILAAVFVAFLSSETGARLTADTTAELRIAMMRAAIASSPRAIDELGGKLGAPTPPPGMKLPPSAPKPGGDAVKLVVLRDAQSTAEFLVATLVTLPQALFALGALAIDLARSGALAVLAGGAGMFVLSRLLGMRASRGVARATSALQASDADVFSEVSEKLTHIEDLRLAGARQEAEREVGEATEKAAFARRGFARALSVSGQITGVLGAMAPLLVLIALSVSGKPPSPGEVAKLLLAIPVVVARLQALDALRVGAIEKSPVLANVRAVLGLPPHPDPSRARIGASALHGGSVRFDEVGFTPAGRATSIVRGITLDIPDGSVVGLCGPSGSGKSTLLRLLLRLDDPTEGSVLIGGTDVREIVVDGLPTVFATLGQQTRLLPRSIANNVMLGRLHGPDRRDRARRALIDAQIAELATDEGLDRHFSAAPANLSGGEQRRVLLARALAQEARVLVLDEPESGLPGGQVEAVLDAAVEAARGRTLVVATHAPDLLRSTFNVLLEGGAVVAQGTHDELLRTNASYAKLFSRRPTS